MSTTKNAAGEVTLTPMNKFPEKLFRDVKSSAAQKGISMKEFFIQSLRYALKTDIVVGKPVVDLEDEDGPEAIRRSSPPDSREGSPRKKRLTKGRNES